MEERLQNILARAGVASRRRSGDLIESGSVEVDGSVVTAKGCKLDPDNHNIVVDGKPLPKEEKKYYFLFHKPKDVISTVSDTHARKMVTDYFKKVDARLYPVGRLDKDTTGILIITNDGPLANRLSHPKYEVEKEYLVTVEGALSESDCKRLELGIILEGKKTAPCEISSVRRKGKYTVLKVILHEGRKRQIRRMFEYIGNEVTDLKRTRYAGLTLGGLQVGEYRELSPEEIEALG